MKILVINAGSSSCKYQLLEMDTRSVLCSGLAERIGQEGGRLTHKIAPDTDKEEKLVREAFFPTHEKTETDQPHQKNNDADLADLFQGVGFHFIF